MNISTFLYILPPLTSGVISLGLAYWIWRRRPVGALAPRSGGGPYGTPPTGLCPAPGATPLALLMLAVAAWSLGYALELGSTNLPTGLFWAKAQYLGIVSLPVACLAFALQYTNREKWLTRRNLILLALVPFLTLLLVWTNDLHGLIWSEIRLDTSNAFPGLDLTHGPWFWINIGYTYLSLLLGTLLLIQAFLRSPHLYRRQASALLVGALSPWAGNALYLSGLSPFPHLDLTPFAFTLTGLALAWGLFRYRLLDIVPVARGVVIEGMSDGVIVLDVQNRIVDLNPAAQRIIGQPAAQVLSARPDLLERYADVTEAREEIILGEGNVQRIYDLRISPLYDRHSHLAGRLVVSHDITERKQVEETLRESEAELATVFDNAPVMMIPMDRERRVWKVNHSTVEFTSRPIVDDYQRWRGRSATYEDYPFTAIVGVPVHWGEEFLGILNVQATPPHTFSQADAELLNLFATQAAIAIRNARLYEQARQEIAERKWAEEKLRARERYLALLNDITRAALETPDFQTMLQTLANQMVELLDADGCYITLWDEAQQTTIPTAAYGEIHEEYSTLRLKPGEVTVTQSVLRAGHSLTIKDVFDTPYLSRRIAEMFPARSLLGLPLMAGDQKLGAALIAFNEPHHFTPDEVARGEQVAGQIALAMAKAQLVQVLRQRTIELEIRNEELDAFAHTVAHDLKNPLTLIIGHTEVLEEDYAIIPRERLRDYLRIIARSGHKVNNIIDELLLLAGVRKKKVEMAPLDMAGIVAKVQQRMANIIGEHQAEIILPDASAWPVAMGHGPWVEEVWVNYLSNALRYGGHPPRVEMGATVQAGGMVRFWVRDNGPGLTPEEQTRLFIPFTQFDQVRTKGHGLGLSIVRRIVEKLGGQVGPESKMGQGSLFWFTLPAQ